MRIYLDIETYRPNEDSSFINEKIIAIGVIEDWTKYEENSANSWDNQIVKPHILKEWELGSEKEIINEFYQFLGNLDIKYIDIIGFNILRFDIPLLTQKGVEYGVYRLENLNKLWNNTFVKDYFQILLPLNQMKFKNLTSEFLVKYAKNKGIKMPRRYGSGSKIKEWYESRRYNGIERHLVADLKIIRVFDLYHRRLFNFKKHLPSNIF